MKIGLKGLITILGKRYGAELVADQLNKWDGRKVDNFKLYFSEMCRREFERRKENEIDRKWTFEKFQGISKEGKKILEQIIVKDIFKEVQSSTEKERLDKKTKILLRSWNDNDKTITKF